MKLSIVIPMYNAEKQIHMLLDSFLSSAQDFEVICVNDGSTDNTVQVIETYKDKRIKIFSKKNEGTFKAWQFGVNKACGEYITIWDADDYIDVEYIDYIYEFITKSGGDILFTPYYVEKENGEKKVHGIAIKDGFYEGDNLNRIRKLLLNGSVPYAKYTKIVKRDIYLKQMSHTYTGQLTDFEDWLTMSEIFEMANSIQISNKPFYHYIQHPNSVSKSTVSYQKSFDSLVKVLKYIKIHDIEKIGQDNFEELSFKALGIVLEKSISIEEYDLADRILNMPEYHKKIMLSDLRTIKKIVFYTRSILAIKIYKKTKCILSNYFRKDDVNEKV